jgi:hypothetical protein
MVNFRGIVIEIDAVGHDNAALIFRFVRWKSGGSLCGAFVLCALLLVAARLIFVAYSIL